MKHKATYQPPDIGTVEELSARLLVANQQLEEANTRLRLSEEQRREMLTNISHDLRSPAAALRSSVDYLFTCEMDDDNAALVLEVMDRRLAVLEHLIDELHYLMTIELPGFAIRPETMDIPAFLEGYLVEKQTEADYAKRRLALDLQMSAVQTWPLDVARMVRVLDNLFDNALRHTAAGGTIVLGGRLLEEKPSPVLEITVRDDGCGVPAEMLEEIFEKTKTVSVARTPGQHPTSGLGLSIVRGIVEKHGGTVRCQSQLGLGSAFIIHLPPACPQG